MLGGCHEGMTAEPSWQAESWAVPTLILAVHAPLKGMPRAA